MTNYKETLQNLIENGATVEKIQEEVKKVNDTLYLNHCKSIASDSKPFASLYEKNTCTIFSFNENTRILNDKEKIVKSIDIEKQYRLINSKANNAKNGKPLPNNDITIFGDFKLTCALHSFIKKCNKNIKFLFFIF